MKRTLIFSLVLALAAVAGAQDKEERKAAKLAARAAAAAASAATPAPASEAAPVATASVANPPQAPSGFDAFRNVKMKSIFDPTRRGLRSESTATAASADAVKRGRSLALTGTMVTEGKALAFFGGSAAEGSRVVSVGNGVAGYTLKTIAPSQVALEREGRQVVLEVGKQLTFEADGEAGLGAAVVEKAAEPMAETTGAPSLPGASGDKAEILRKMMERRAKEVGK